MSSKGTLATREADVTDIDAELVHWTPRQVALVARTVAMGASPEELRLFLSQARALNLNPLNGEIWCVKTRGDNGSEGRIAIIVGEQGRLKVANRYEDYRGYRSDVIRQNDRFLKLPEPKPMLGVEGQYTYVEHSYGMPADRGEVAGAWCEVYREGRPPTFFFAPLTDYFPTDASERAQKFIPWFKTLDRQIVKCAISTAFRMGFPLLAGVYGEEEIHHIQTGAVEGESDLAEGIEWGESNEVAERMQSLFAAANNAAPGTYPEAKIKLMMGGITDDERMRIAAEEIIPFITKAGGRVPEPGEQVVDDAEVQIVEPDEQPGDADRPEG